MVTSEKELEERRAALQRWWRDQPSEPDDATLGPLVPASSGFSNETYLFDLVGYENPGIPERSYVVRCMPSGAVLLPDYDLRFQYDVMRELGSTTVPVPRPIAYEADDTVLGSPFFIMEKVEGVVASGRYPGFHGHGLFFDATLARREQMWWEAVDVMAALHRLDWQRLELPSSVGSPETVDEAVAAEAAKIGRWLDWADLGPLPVLEEGLEYVTKTSCAAKRLVLCWGDARPGNIIYRDGHVASVLDWELAYLAPPEFDLAYFTLIDGVTAEINQVPRLAGIPEAAATAAHYERVTKHPLEAWDFAQIFQALRLGALLVLAVHMSPPNLNYVDDFLTNNIPTHRLAELLGKTQT
ncbi:phosphotransferase family protein [Frankia sp. Cr2]|uniref:phosphotransferase family protein n=1 Tax=Frankia sp. Cr2 TaxID=3073932 RepID=UPI002AD31221|nr:phosphotransferase family protein [Frankia sp. Cr2]